MFNIEWSKMLKFHEHYNGQVTLLVHPNSHPYDSDLLIMDKYEHVIGIDSKKNERNYWYENCVNSGIYILSNNVIQNMRLVCKLDLEKGILVPLMEQKMVFGYRTPEYVKDVGIPERFEHAKEEERNGIWEKKCLNQKQRCVFLDRDGTINRYKGFIYQEEQFELEDYVTEAIQILNRRGYLVIVVTNQPVIARGLCNVEDVNQIHRKMQVLLGEGEAFLDDIIFCPHHPDSGYLNENPKYKIPCDCRKPAVGMIEKMASKYNIDLSNSYMIGDTTVDIQTGINAGMKTVLVLTGEAGTDGKYSVKPDFVAGNLLDAVLNIIENEDTETK